MLSPQNNEQTDQQPVWIEGNSADAMEKLLEMLGIPIEDAEFDNQKERNERQWVMITGKSAAIIREAMVEVSQKMAASEQPPTA
jgi:hypothetical protein